MVVEVGDHFFLLSMLVVLERLGVLVPEVVVDHRVQPGRVEVHVLLRVLLVGHCRAWCLKSLKQYIGKKKETHETFVEKQYFE